MSTRSCTEIEKSFSRIPAISTFTTTASSSIYTSVGGRHTCGREESRPVLDVLGPEWKSSPVSYQSKGRKSFSRFVSTIKTSRWLLKSISARFRQNLNWQLPFWQQSAPHHNPALYRETACNPHKRIYQNDPRRKPPGGECASP